MMHFLRRGRGGALWDGEGKGGGGDGGGGGGDGGGDGGGGKNNGVQNGDPGWYGQFNDASRSVLREAAIKEPNELVKVFGDYRKNAGQYEGFIRPLGDNPTPEERASFFKAIGVGEKPEAYAWEDIDVKGMNPTFLAAMQKGMAAHGVPLGAAKGFVKDMLDHITGVRGKELKDAEAAVTQEEQQFDSTYGAKAKEARALGARAAAALGFSEEDIQKIGGAVGLGKIREALYRAGSAFREGRRLPGGEGLPNVDGDSFEGAEARLKAFKTDPKLRKALLNGDADLLAEQTRLSKIVAEGKGN